MFKKSLFILPISVIASLTLISCFFIPIIANSDTNINFNTSKETSVPQVEIITLTNKFAWPVPGYKRITSQFGYRNAPTAGASTYHGGIDIAAPTGAKLIATFSGKVTFTGFSGAGGYTIIIQNGNFTAMYCHVSPNYMTKKNQYVEKGEVIRKCGTKKCI